MPHCAETVDILHNIRLELTLTLDVVINLRLGLLYITWFDWATENGCSFNSKHIWTVFESFCKDCINELSAHEWHHTFVIISGKLGGNNLLFSFVCISFTVKWQ